MVLMKGSYQGDEDEAPWSIFDQLSESEIWNVLDFLVNDMGFYHEGNKTAAIEVSCSYLGM